MPSELLYIFFAALLVLQLIAVVIIVRLRGDMASLRSQDSEARLQALLQQHAAQLSAQMEALRSALLDALSQSRIEQGQQLNGSLQSLGEQLQRQSSQVSEVQDKRLADISQQLGLRQDTLQKTLVDLLNTHALQNATSLEGIRQTVERRLTAIQEDNSSKLDQMRVVIDEKLQKTLEERIGHSFRMVSERLEQVYKGLGEMQTLAAGVGDLQKVLSNVKTRGILGEIQLGAILEQILNPGQYYTDHRPRPNSAQVVEFAVRLPGDDSGEVLLPIDAKFPADVYSRLMDAYEGGVSEEIEAAGKELERVMRNNAKDIQEKYVEPPHTTDFAVMFLPFEGLYAEVVRRGVFETLQRDFRVMIAGPSTMAALLSSLQMGFRTLAIQKRSDEVWRILASVKTEFGKFGDALQSAQKRLDATRDDLEKLVGTRTRSIQRSLRGITELPVSEIRLLEEADEPER